MSYKRKLDFTEVSVDSEGPRNYKERSSIVQRTNQPGLFIARNGLLPGAGSEIGTSSREGFPRPQRATLERRDVIQREKKMVSKASLTNRLVTKPVSKEIYEYWIQHDLCYRSSIGNRFSAEGCSLSSNSSGSSNTTEASFLPIRSSDSETSRSLTSSSGYFDFNESEAHSVLSDFEYETIANSKYRSLFEKLLFSLHSRTRVEVVKNILSRTKLNRRREDSATILSSDNQESTSPLLSLRDRIQDLRIKVKQQVKLQKEQKGTLQDLKSKVSQLSELKSTLTKKISETKQQIALKEQFAENFTQEIIPKVEVQFFDRLKNSKEIFLRASAKKCRSTPVSARCISPSPTKDPYSLIQKYLALVKEIKASELNKPAYDANIKIRHESRVIACQLSCSEIVDEITTQTVAGAIRLSTSANPTVLSIYKDKAPLDSQSLCQNKMHTYFSADSPVDYSLEQLCQDLRKALLPKQLELKEKTLQLEQVKRDLDLKIDMLCEDLGAGLSEKKRRQQIYYQSIARALKKISEISIEQTYQPPSLVKSRLNCDLEPSAALRQITREISQISERLQFTRKDVLGLCRSLEVVPQKFTHQNDALSPALTVSSKDAVKWIKVELQHTNRVPFDALVGVRLYPTLVPQHTASQFPSPLIDAQIVPASLLTIHGPRFHNTTGLFAWHKTRDWDFPLLVELRTRARLTQQLCNFLRQQARHHEVLWDASLRLQTFEQNESFDTILGASEHYDFEPKFDFLFNETESLWKQLPQVHIDSLQHANNVDIPQALMLYQDVKDILSERDGLLNSFNL